MRTKLQVSHPRQTLIATVAVSLAAVAAAQVTQHAFDMQPCPWCILQRVIFLVVALVGSIALLWRSGVGRIVTGSLMSLLALAGAACAVWQHFVAAKSQSCNFTLADKIVSRYLQLDTLAPELFEVRATCADAAVNLLGIPYDFWSLALFVLIAIATVRFMLPSRV
jgi:disulfide bond formation protein DsbB